MNDSRLSAPEESTIGKNNLEPEEYLLALDDLQSKVENLQYLLMDKENFIDNLISRAGELESSVVAKDEYAEKVTGQLEIQTRHIRGIEQTIAARDKIIQDLEQSILEKDQYIGRITEQVELQKNHIANLDKAILQRDEHVANIDRNNKLTAELLEASQLSKQIITDLTKNIEWLCRQDAVFDERFSDLAGTFKSLINKQGNKIESKFAHRETLLDDQHRDQKSTLEAQFSKQHLNTDLLSRQSEKLAQEIAELKSLVLLANEARDSHNAKLLVEHSREIDHLEQQIEYRDSWGENIQARLDLVASQLSLIHASTSWRLTRPLRFLSRATRLTLKKIGQLLFFPIRVIIKLGWLVAPKLFHRLYHLPLIQSIWRTSAINKYQASQNISSAPALNNTEIEARPLPSTSALSANLGVPVTSIPDNKWKLGKRIDGPTQG